MPAPSMAVMALGKLMVVTRLVATGTDTTVRSSSKTCWMAGESASATAAVNTDNGEGQDFSD